MLELRVVESIQIFLRTARMPVRDNLEKINMETRGKVPLRLEGLPIEFRTHRSQL
jgi:hypothetical protein